jgi:hypothetical protein
LVENNPITSPWACALGRSGGNALPLSAAAPAARCRPFEQQQPEAAHIALKNNIHGLRAKSNLYGQLLLPPCL